MLQSPHIYGTISLLESIVNMGAVSWKEEINVKDLRVIGFAERAQKNNPAKQPVFQGTVKIWKGS